MTKTLKPSTLTAWLLAKRSKKRCRNAPKKAKTTLAPSSILPRGDGCTTTSLTVEKKVLPPLQLYPLYLNLLSTSALFARKGHNYLSSVKSQSSRDLPEVFLVFLFFSVSRISQLTSFSVSKSAVYIDRKWTKIEKMNNLDDLVHID